MRSIEIGLTIADEKSKNLMATFADLLNQTLPKMIEDLRKDGLTIDGKWSVIYRRNEERQADELSIRVE